MWLPVEAVVFTQTPSLINGSIRVDPLGLVLPFSLDNNLRSVTRDRGTTEKRSCSSVDLENFLDSMRSEHLLIYQLSQVVHIF